MILLDEIPASGLKQAQNEAKRGCSAAAVLAVGVFMLPQCSRWGAQRAQKSFSITKVLDVQMEAHGNGGNLPK